MRWRCVMAAASLVERTLACQAGMPMATRMPMIEMTIISSTSEKPRRPKIFLFVLILSKPHCLEYTCVTGRSSTKRPRSRRRGGGPMFPAEKFYYTEPRKSHGHQMKAKVKRQKAKVKRMPCAARHLHGVSFTQGSPLLLPFAFLLLPLEW